MLALSLVLALSGAGPKGVPAAKETGDLWEVTCTMSIEGMPVGTPPMTQNACTSKSWTEPPGGSVGKGCETLDFKHTEAATTWKVRCAGPPAMTGDGEITRTGADAFKGSIKIQSELGAMTMTLDGRRLGDCDVDAAKP